MIGVSQLGNGVLDTKKSYLKNWQKTSGKNTSGVPQNIGSSTAEQFRATGTGGVMCSAVSSTANHSCVFEGASSAANTKYVYLNLSVWSNA